MSKIRKMQKSQITEDTKKLQNKRTAKQVVNMYDENMNKERDLEYITPKPSLQILNKNTLYTQLEQIPDKPGVYQYYDSRSCLLYVGKAKNLKKRIRSYFAKDLTPNPRNSFRIQHMVAQIESIHTIIVENEREALILENSFIKSQNPKYNILLRDDKTYPYITINLNDCYPRFSITRNIVQKKGIQYFGPYPRGAKEILNSLYEIFPFVQQASCLKGKKPCLYYQIEKCLGVCAFDSTDNKVSYDSFIKHAIELMQNKHKLKKLLEQKMEFFAQKELFEQALVCKNCIRVLQEIETFCVVDMKKIYNADVLSFLFYENQGILLKLFVRNGKVISSHHLFVRANTREYIKAYNEKQSLMHNCNQQGDKKRESVVYNDSILHAEGHPDIKDSVLLKQSASLEQKDIKMQNENTQENFKDEFECEIYTQAILKTIHEGGFCDEIILANITEKNFALLQETIPEMAKKLVMPKRGEKLRLAELANRNALHLLQDKVARHKSENDVLQAIASLFLLDRDIANIEVFDTSHHAGSFVVGGMVSYSNNNFNKENYRHYNLQGKDEYTQMREMLSRRAASFDSLPAPDLWLLDGGRAQINLALEILESSGANTEVLAIAKEKRDFKANRSKGSARDILRSKNLEFRLESNDPRLQFLQKLRDEVHAFAISFHRYKKTKNISLS